MLICLEVYNIIKNNKHRNFYYRTYNDLTLREIVMNKIDFKTNTPRLKMPLSKIPRTLNVTEQFLKTTTDAVNSID